MSVRIKVKIRHKKKPKFVSESDLNIVYKFCDKYDVNPNVVLAIGWHETHWGKLGAGREGYILGVGVYDPVRKNPRYKGLSAQLRWAVPRLYLNLPDNPDEADFVTFAERIWKPGNPTAWGKSVYLLYSKFNKIYPVTREEVTGNGQGTLHLITRTEQSSATSNVIERKRNTNPVP